MTEMIATEHAAHKQKGLPLKVEVFQCRGSAYEVGLKIAEEFKRTPRGRSFARRRERKPFAFSFLNAKYNFLRYAENIWAELNGIADGLSIPIERAVAEFGNGRLRYPRRGCSAALGNGYYARNYDFSPSRYDRRLILIQPEGNFGSIGFAERLTGRLDGMNEKGLCIGLHAVNGGLAEPGFTCLLLVRMVLDQCATTQDAIDLLSDVPHGLCFNYSILDAKDDAAVFEGSPFSFSVRRHEFLACTNHFQTSEMQFYNQRATKRSRDRLPYLKNLAETLPHEISLFERLNQVDSPAFFQRYSRGFGTLHTMVCNPRAQQILLGIGGNARPTFIDFRRWLDGISLSFQHLSGRIENLAPQTKRQIP